ncbi:hypothetical protein FRX31_022682, partial [Thalictrum thalictroides]
MCNSTKEEVEWEMVKNKVAEQVGETSLTILSGNKAILAMNSLESSRKLESLKTLLINNTIISFVRWTPEMGALKGVEEIKSKWVTLRGIPWHLRTNKVVIKLMESFCRDFDIEEATVDFRCDAVKVKINHSKMENIPRIIFLEERGFSFSILLELEVEKENSSEIVAAPIVGDDGRKEMEVVRTNSEKERNVRVVQQVVNKDTPNTRARVEEEGSSATQQSQKLGDNEWIRVSSKVQQPKPNLERSWAQVVHSGRYDPIREVVEDTPIQKLQPNEVQAQVSNNSQQRPGKGKVGVYNKAFFTGPPSLRLSRQLWPTNGGKFRFGKIKQLARQALDNEYQQEAGTSLRNTSDAIQVLETSPSHSPSAISLNMFSSKTGNDGASVRQEQVGITMLKKNHSVESQTRSRDYVALSESISSPP